MANRPLVIFDVDGTLFDGSGATLAATRQALAEMGLPAVADAAILDTIGGTWEEFGNMLAPDYPAQVRSRLATLTSRYEQAYLPTLGRVYDGAAALLRQLTAAGYVLAVCSNGSAEYLDLALAHEGLRPFFATIKSHQPGKTKRDLVRELLEEYHPAHAIVVGDRLPDLQAAHAWNLPCIAVQYGFSNPGEIDAADIIVKSIAEVAPALARVTAFR